MRKTNPRTFSSFFRSFALNLILVAFALSQAHAIAADKTLDCLDKSQPVPIDNAEVLNWKDSTNNQFLARAHIEGTLTKVYPQKSGHTHFEVKIGPKPTDTIEAVYNNSFGKLPALKSNMKIEACGDYITSTQETPQYPPSPDGAIIHWIHRNPKPSGHDSGFLMIDGVPYGQGNGR